MLGNGADSAEKICQKLKDQVFPFRLEEMEEASILMITHYGMPAQEKKEKEQRKNGTSFFPILPQTVRITGNGGEVRKGTRRKRQER